jgi:hypothetical protein
MITHMEWAEIQKNEKISIQDLGKSCTQVFFIIVCRPKAKYSGYCHFVFLTSIAIHCMD